MSKSKLTSCGRRCPGCEAAAAAAIWAAVSPRRSKSDELRGLVSWTKSCPLSASGSLVIFRAGLLGLRTGPRSLPSKVFDFTMRPRGGPLKLLSNEEEAFSLKALRIGCGEPRAPILRLTASSAGRPRLCLGRFKLVFLVIADDIDSFFLPIADDMDSVRLVGDVGFKSGVLRSLVGMLYLPVSEDGRFL